MDNIQNHNVDRKERVKMDICGVIFMDVHIQNTEGYC